MSEKKGLGIRDLGLGKRGNERGAGQDEKAGMMRTRRGTTGFSLLEIMISVVILALGLLGLGALFPVVIRSQRLASDETYGAMAADTAVSMLKTMDFEKSLRPQPVPPPSPPLPEAVIYPPRNIWHLMRGYDDPDPTVPRDMRYLPSRMGGLGPPAPYQHGQWYVPPIDNVTNKVELGDGTLRNTMELPVTLRLYPQGSPNLAPPQYVWDVAVQRVDDGILDRARSATDFGNDASTDAVRVAVFVRRLDLRIRPAMNRTVYAVVADDATPNADRRRPVGVNNTTGLPTGDGSGNYAAPFTLPVEVRNNAMNQPERDRLYVPPTVTAEQWAMIRQPGQILVDNLGNIHTVRSSSETGALRWVVLEVEMPSSVARVRWADNVDVLNSVVLTPQVPVAVRVFRVEP